MILKNIQVFQQTAESFKTWMQSLFGLKYQKRHQKKFHHKFLQFLKKLFHFAYDIFKILTKPLSGFIINRDFPVKFYLLARKVKSWEKFFKCIFATKFKNFISKTMRNFMIKLR